jgi:transcriptional regulator with XRE-family HTH domain
VATKEKSKTTNNPALITGDIITWARERLGYSYKQVADEIGASVTAEDIAQWEAEKTLPNFKKAQKLATACTSRSAICFSRTDLRTTSRLLISGPIGSKPIQSSLPIF